MKNRCDHLVGGDPCENGPGPHDTHTVVRMTGKAVSEMAEVKVGDWVEYHGTSGTYHGMSFEVVVVDKWPMYPRYEDDTRYTLYHRELPYDRDTLENVRRESFTIIGK